jgi:RHH-type proline utilization regulon transcriptional repressor/proline dehydrogenase/delta 1-pyrroline-5-carboxylate dehydrogenase
MLEAMTALHPDPLRAAIRAATYAAEADLVPRLAAAARLDGDERAAIARAAADRVRRIRSRARPTMMEAFLAEYGLSTAEGVGLMCLAEALLRVPDAPTIDALIADKIEPSDWGAHLGRSASPLVNAATWGLFLTGRILEDEPGPAASLRALLRRLGEPVVRTAVARAMKLMGSHFVLGETIEAAMARARAAEAKGYTHSYDMLGEAARTEADARRYAASYAHAIAAIAPAATGDVRTSPGVSVKLSALHPRYEWSQRARVMRELLPRARDLARAAARAGIGFNIDAEEADRLDLSLDVIDALLSDPDLAGWEGFGIVVQAYGRRAMPVIDWIDATAARLGRRLMVRLVKGAYWDAEIKQAQERGVESFPVFTRKVSTDVSYLACARRLLDARPRLYPQFATHNAHSVEAVLHMAGNDREALEFQRLHGMGETLHEIVREEAGTRCRIYAPVGAHRDLLAYLVRRLLENGANSSFVNQIVDESVAPEAIAADPLAAAEALRPVENPAISPPGAIFAPRRNSRGWHVNEPASILPLLEAREAFRHARWRAGPVIAGPVSARTSRAVVNPADPSETVGEVVEATRADVTTALAAASHADWSARPPPARAAILRRASDLYEENAAEFCALAAREAGKTLADAIAELREAVDFLRYYADAAETLDRPPRGTLVCISPWNFPLAIFTGQVAGALAAGNAVIAKPAEQTPLIAHRAVEFLHAAGVPAAALQCLPGDGPSVGAPLSAAPGIAGIVFTGSTETARIIERSLAAHAAPDAVLVAETGGINAMIVDTTALPEQVTRDVLASAFQSAGQRCSALRVLSVQREAEARLLEMIAGAAETLVLGDPWDPATDIGPLIDDEAHAGIARYIDGKRAALLRQIDAPPGPRFLGPAILRVTGIEAVEREIFGPVLHVATHEGHATARVVEAINARGYGLTFGLHSRIDDRVEAITARLKVGNAYVNRNQIGAIVGSQPFGGEGLSGTGPKAGGPHYVAHLAAPEPAAEAAPEGPVHGLAALAASAAGLAPAASCLAPARLAVLRALDPAAAEGLAEDLFAPLDLPGPTGESNRLRVFPRGLVLVLGPDRRLARVQMLRALAAGNAVLAVTPEAPRLADPLRQEGFAVAALDGQSDPEALAALPGLALVAAHGPRDWLRALRRGLARREGPIVPLETGRPLPLRFVVERHLCIDTTASGGNASLLAAGG